MKQANRTLLRMICLLVAFTLLSTAAVFAAAAVEETTQTDKGTTTTTNGVIDETTEPELPEESTDTPKEAMLILKYRLVHADGSFTEFDKTTVMLGHGVHIIEELQAQGYIERDGKQFLPQSSSFSYLTDGGRTEETFDEKTLFDATKDNAVLILVYGATESGDATDEKTTVAVREIDGDGQTIGEYMEDLSFGTNLYEFARNRAKVYGYYLVSVGVIYADGSTGTLTSEDILVSENPVTHMEIRFAYSGSEEKIDIQIETSSTWYGEYGEIRFELTKGAFASFQMQLHFSSCINVSELLEDTEGDMIYNIQDGYVLVTLSRDSNLYAETTLFTLRYTVRYEGDYYLSFSDYRFVDEDGNEIYNCNIGSAGFAMPEQNTVSLLGDANGDGAVDSDDYLLIQRVWVEEDCFYNDQCRDNADVNRDGNADILDVQWIRLHVNKGITLWA